MCGNGYIVYSMSLPKWGRSEWLDILCFILELIYERLSMNIVSFTDAHNGLKRVLDQVINDADCTVITRRDAEGAVVMSLDYYNSLMETVYLLKSPANAAHLARSIEQYRTGQVIEQMLIDKDGMVQKLDVLGNIWVTIAANDIAFRKQILVIQITNLRVLSGIIPISWQIY